MDSPVGASMVSQLMACYSSLLAAILPSLLSPAINKASCDSKAAARAAAGEGNTRMMASPTGSKAWAIRHSSIH